MPKKLILAAYAASALVFGQAVLPSGASADVMNNFRVPEPERLRAVSSDLLEAVSQIVQAVSVAERGDYKKAQDLLDGAVKALVETRERFAQLATTGGDEQPVSAVPQGSVSGTQIEDIFKRYDLVLPSTQTGLATIAVQEVDRFVERSTKLSLTDADTARASVLVLSASMSRLFDVGVAVSALAQ